MDNGTQLEVWDLRTREIVHTLSTEGVYLSAAAFSRDGRYLAAAGGDTHQHGDRSLVRVWDAATGALVYDFQRHRVWDMTTGKEALALRGHAGPVILVAFSPDGRRLYSTSHDHTLRIWDATPLSEGRGAELQVLRAHTGRVNRVAWSPDGKYLASGGVEGNVLLWDLETGQVIRTLRGHSRTAITGLRFSSDGSRLAGVGSVDDPEIIDDVGLLKVWDIPAGRELLAVPPRRLSALSGVGFLPGGTALALAAERGLQIVDARTGDLLQTSPLLPEGLGPGGLALSPDGRFAAGSSCTHRVLVWDVPRYADSCAASAALTPLPMAHALGSVLGRLLLAPPRSFAVPDFVPDLAFSGDGRYLVTASTGGPLHVWDTAGWQQLPDLEGHAGLVWGLAASPDGRHLASAGSDGTVRLWDVRTRTEVGVRRGHTDAVFAVAFSPDGRRLASGGRDQTVRIWDVCFLAERPGRGPAGVKAER
jgi:WD40 repeat protein